MSLNLGIGIEVTFDTQSKAFLISPTYLKLVLYEANNFLSSVPGFWNYLSIYTKK